MARTVRVTGAHYRYDDDTRLWNSFLRVIVKDGDGITFDEFVTRVATLTELLAWILAILDGYAAQADTTVSGH